MDHSEAHLLFVYNANSGVGRAIIDAVHKVVSPSTYSCSLCAITYGAVSMRGAWKTALARLPLPSRFLHRDEFRNVYPASEIAFPAVLLVRNGHPVPLVEGPMLDRLVDIPALVEAITVAIRTLDDRLTPSSE